MRLGLVPRRQHVPDVAPWHVDSGSTTAYQLWVSAPLPSFFSAQVLAESKLGKKSFSVQTPAWAGSPAAAHDETARRTAAIIRLDRATLDNLRMGSLDLVRVACGWRRAPSRPTIHRVNYACRGATWPCRTPAPPIRPVNGGRAPSPVVGRDAACLFPAEPVCYSG